MKKIYTGFLVLLTGGLLAGCQSEESRIYPYPFDTARLEVTHSGNVEGTTTIQIKGDKSVHETHAVSTVGGGEQKLNMILIDTGSELFSINLDTKQGMKMENPVTKQLKSLPKEQRVDFLTRLAAGIAPGEEGALKPVSSREVAGQKCDVYNIGTFGDICVWYGMPLASSMTVPGTETPSVTEATKIELNVEVPDSAFLVPEGITIQ